MLVDRNFISGFSGDAGTLHRNVLPLAVCSLITEESDPRKQQQRGEGQSLAPRAEGCPS